MSLVWPLSLGTGQSVVGCLRTAGSGCSRLPQARVRTFPDFSWSIGLCPSVAVQPLDDEGTVLDAEYHVERDGQTLALILKGRGGGQAGSSPPRNPDYNRALSILLRRLARLDAVLVEAFVDARNFVSSSQGVHALENRVQILKGRPSDRCRWRWTAPATGGTTQFPELLAAAVPSRSGSVRSVPARARCPADRSRHPRSAMLP